MKKHENIVFIDTETGGLDPRVHSLLSIGLVRWEDSVITKTKEILINDGKLNVTDAALAINKIDLNRLKIKAISQTEAIQEILLFIEWAGSQQDKITLAGHNVGFDIKFIRNLFESQNYNFDDYFSHRSIDTSSILHYFYLTGKLDTKIVGSSDAFKHFEIEVRGRHTALGDAIATAELFTKMINLP
jgi:DNA polymerase III epsilon subunit-like protein